MLHWRTVLVTLGLAALVAAVPVALAQQSGDATPVTVTMPAWSMRVIGIVNPFTGPLTATPIPDHRSVAVGFEVVNDSQVDLTIGLWQFRLRDTAGREYSPSSTIAVAPPGPQPLNYRRLAPGERAQGWLWFALPLAAEPAQVVFLPPGPELRANVDQLPVGIPTLTSPVPATVTAPPTPSPVPTGPPTSTASREPTQTPPTATPSSTATPPADGLAPGTTAVVLTDADLRVEPGGAAALIGTLSAGAEVTVLDGARVEADGFTWLPIASKLGPGWVVATVLAPVWWTLSDA
jgi:hypothetical protein